MTDSPTISSVAELLLLKNISALLSKVVRLKMDTNRLSILELMLTESVALLSSSHEQSKAE